MREYYEYLENENSEQFDRAPVKGSLYERLGPWLILAFYFLASGLAYGLECEELLPGEAPSGEIRVCTRAEMLELSLPDWFSCTTDTDCLHKCLDLEAEGIIPKGLCNEV